MDAYEQVRDDVLAQYQSIARRDGREPYAEQEGREIVASAALPGVGVTASQPAWLGREWRVVVIVASLLGVVGGLVLMWFALQVGDDNGAAGWVAGFSGVFAIVALVVAYLTVGGFGEAKFSVGQGADEKEKPPEG